MSKEKAEKRALNIFQKGYNQQVIFYGPPGTSKTYTSTILAANTLKMTWNDKQWTNNNHLDTATEEKEAEKSEYEKAQEYLKRDEVKNRFALVQFHPSYTYEDFIRGIKVDTNNNNQVTYEVVNKVFGEMAEKASSDKSGQPYVLIIDEINRAPLASVLGELIYGLEYRGNPFSTPYTLKEKEEEKEEKETNQLIVPPNLFIIGTMNTADRSIGAMDYAVRRRFAFISLPSEPAVIMKTWNKFIEEVKQNNLQDKAMAEAFGRLICDIDRSPTSDSTENDAESSSTTDSSEPKYKDLYAQVKELFDKNNMADPSIDREDIMLGHTYFLCDPAKCIDVDSAKDFMQYRLDYQIKPILKEYVKDGLLDGNKVSKKIDELTLDPRVN